MADPAAMLNKYIYIKPVGSEVTEYGKKSFDKIYFRKKFAIVRLFAIVTIGWLSPPNGLFI